MSQHQPNDGEPTTEVVDDTVTVSRRPILTFLIIPLALVFVLGGTILFGSNANSRLTGSREGLIQVVREQIATGSTSGAVDVQISTVSNQWASFSVTRLSSQGGTLVAHGYAQFRSPAWVIVATGTGQVGCRSAASAESVPLPILHGFGVYCSTP